MATLSLIIPVFNEKETIGNFLNELGIFLRQDTGVSECIIVDDGSNDGTSAVLSPSPGLIAVLRHSVNKGYGASIKTGLEKAGGEFFCIVDADGSYTLGDIRRLMPFMDGYDLVVGARPKTHMPLRQKIAKSAVAAVLGMLFGQRVEDINSGLMLMRRDFIQRYAFLLSDAFSFSAGATLLMLLARRRIKYVPIAYLSRQGGSKVKLCSYTLNFLKGYGRIIRYQAKNRIK